MACAGRRCHDQPARRPPPDRDPARRGRGRPRRRPVPLSGLRPNPDHARPGRGDGADGCARRRRLDAGHFHHAPADRPGRRDALCSHGRRTDREMPPVWPPQGSATRRAAGDAAALTGGSETEGLRRRSAARNA
uniref:LigA n=1 Tax=Parastrongyloides trichosuri TaxID=131310 RepID=A0A0N4ZGV3_PARTI